MHWTGKGKIEKKTAESGGNEHKGIFFKQGNKEMLFSRLTNACFYDTHQLLLVAILRN